jgi:hypothetical protein
MKTRIIIRTRFASEEGNIQETTAIETRALNEKKCPFDPIRAYIV